MAGNPEFVIFAGPMFGGKTSRMLAALDRAKYQSKNIQAFKPKMDHRYAEEKIVTHAGHNWQAICISEGSEILDYSSGVDVVAVDEAFMIEGSGDAMVWLFKRGHTILISSLQLSSDGSPYPEVAKMFPYATHVEVCPAVCQTTKKDAYYTEKIGGRSDHQIEVGGADMYQPRCWQEFFGRG